jgi:hypothetical protein
MPPPPPPPAIAVLEENTELLPFVAVVYDPLVAPVPPAPIVIV